MTPKGINLDSIKTWDYLGDISQNLDEQIKITKWGPFQLYTWFRRAQVLGSDQPAQIWCQPLSSFVAWGKWPNSMTAAVRGRHVPCVGATRRNWLERALWFQWAYQVIDSTVCCLPIIYRDRRRTSPLGETVGLENWIENSVPHRKLQSRGVEVWQHTVCLWLSTCIVTFLSSEACFQESGTRHFYPLRMGHSAWWLRADPLFSLSLKTGTFQVWLEPPLVLPSGTEMRGKIRII